MAIKLSTMKSNPKNPRLIKDDKFKKLVKSLEEDSWLMEGQPIIIDNDNIILAGNMRFKALQELGYKEVDDKWIKKYDDLTDDQKRRAIIKTNIGYGEHDWDMLNNEWDIDELEEWGLDIPDFAKIEPEIEEDEAPEVSSEPAVSKLGEIYQLGRHRVMCGDSTKDVDKLFDTATIGFTSPPYNVGKNAVLSFHKKKANKYETYDDDNEDYYELLESFNKFVIDKCKYSFVNLQILAGNKKQILTWLYSNVDRFCDIAFWKKNTVQPSMADNVMNSQTECIFIFGGNGSRAINTGSFRGNVSNFIETPSAQADNKNSDIHNATMPVALASHFIINFTQENDSVYDAFIGTGTTLIACEQTNRICYGMELDPKYVDVIRKRYWKLLHDGDDTGWENGTPIIKEAVEKV